MFGENDDSNLDGTIGVDSGCGGGVGGGTDEGTGFDDGCEGGTGGGTRRSVGASTFAMVQIILFLLFFLVERIEHSPLSL